MVENSCNKILIFGKNAWLLHSFKESIAVFGIVINFRLNEGVSLFEEIVIVLSSSYIYGIGQSGRRPQLLYCTTASIHYQKPMVLLPVIVLIKCWWHAIILIMYFDRNHNSQLDSCLYLKGEKARLLDSNVLSVLPSSIEGSLINFLATSTLQEASVSTQ